MINSRRTLNNFTGCLLGGAVGDALGAPIEFMNLEQIRSNFGKTGLTDYVEAYGRIGAITDDTQMTMFTAEGLLRANHREEDRGICSPPAVVANAYLRWLATQGEISQNAFTEDILKDGFLIQTPELHSVRAPGNTCLSALRKIHPGERTRHINNSKGCGGVMRVAPVGLSGGWGDVFELGCEIAELTHGHPTGYLAAGCLALIISEIVSGNSLEESINQAVSVLKTKDNHEECLDAIEVAIDLSKNAEPCPETVERIGAGWIAEEALAISLYCALIHQDDFKQAVLLAVNHSGDSDSTGSITGNILGSLLGKKTIPEKWLLELELKDVIGELASDLLTEYRRDKSWHTKYPCY
jgi:ADP-ribosyl-[dinitrogen reductase] hydrolase